MKKYLYPKLNKLPYTELKLSKKLSLLLVGTLGLSLFIGCSDREGEHYSVEEVESASQQEPQETSKEELETPSTEELGFRYATPDSWENQGSSRMIKLGFVAGEPPMKTADITISSFPGDVGGTLANVNRWRRQVGLGPLSENVLEDFVKPVEITGKEGWQVDFTGPSNDEATGEGNRVIVTTLPMEEETWFFKILGPESAVEDEHEAYREFIDSIEFKEE